MIFKKNTPQKKDKKIIQKIFIIYFYITITIFTVATVAFLNTGIWQNNKKQVIQRIHLNGIYNYKYVPHILKIVLINMFSKLDTLYIDIDHKNIIKIENNRIEKIKNNKTNFIKAKAEIKYKDQVLNTSIRLKGDRAIHYEDMEKSSYRLELKKNNFYKGMKSFSIQKPRIRNYVWEWIFHEFNEEFNSIKLKYEFVNLNINGKNKGLYVIEEVFSNNLLEKNKRRAGPIFGLDENFSTNFEIAKLDVYEAKYWKKTSNQKIFLTAKAKIAKLKDRDIPLNEIFDIKKWANYFVISDLLGTQHGYFAKSVKMYYNPISGLIEPIPFDGHKIPHYNYHESIKEIYQEINLSSYDEALKKGTWLKYFFLNKDESLNILFYKEYLKSLKRITDKNFLDLFFKENLNKINLINSKIYLDSFKADYNSKRKSGIGIYYFDKEDIYKRSEFLIKRFSFDKDLIKVEDTDSKIIISNLSKTNLRSQIISIDCEFIIDNQKKIKSIIFQKYLTFKDQHIIKNQSNLENSKCFNLRLKDAINNKIYDIKIDLVSREKIKKINYNYLNFFKKNNKNILSLKENFLKIDRNIFIPSGYSISVSPGQSILLIDNAFIFSESNWIINGEISNPVNIMGTKNNFGGGIFINSPHKSILRNLNVSYLSGLDMSMKNKDMFTKTSISKNNDNIYNYLLVKNPNYKNNLSEYKIFGAINFFETSVELHNITYSNISSEDTINIIKSNFLINHNNFFNINSDAIDIDFSEGVIKNVKFRNISNDALDFSGSKVEIQNVFANNIGDKVVSSGENSTININYLDCINSFIGVANKDGSQLIIRNSKLKNIIIPFAAYRKKNAYDNADMLVFNSTLENYKSKFTLSEFASLKIDNEMIRQNYLNKDILKIIYDKKSNLIKDYQ
tara:strand:- start:117 stop:2822 length:2706 start_codon:yes stop_codon:yes gene_type:complete